MGSNVVVSLHPPYGRFSGFSKTTDFFFLFPNIRDLQNFPLWPLPQATHAMAAGSRVWAPRKIAFPTLLNLCDASIFLLCRDETKKQ